MDNTLEFKPKAKIFILENRRKKLLEKQQSMDNYCFLQEWFEISNKIRDINKKIAEILYVRSHSKDA